MQHDSIFRCIQATCGRTLPRSVNFCPYCGTAQHEDARRTEGHAAPPAGRHEAGLAPSAHAGVPTPPTAAPTQPVPTPAPPTPPMPAQPVQPAQPAQPQPGAAGAGPSTGSAAAASAAAATEARRAMSNASAAIHGPGASVSPSGPHPADTGARAGSALPPGARPQAGARPGGPQAAPPPQRQPVRLRWWLLALAALWVIWLWAKPSTRRIEAQMDKAIALAQECKPREAQTELIALRKTRATPEQLQRVQKALNDASGMCTRKRQRDKAWREAKNAVESALASSSVDRARQRLRTFTRRWGEDDETRALKEEIDARQPEHPRADEIQGGMLR